MSGEICSTLCVRSYSLSGCIVSCSQDRQVKTLPNLHGQTRLCSPGRQDDDSKPSHLGRFQQAHESPPANSKQEHDLAAKERRKKKKKHPQTSLLYSFSSASASTHSRQPVGRPLGHRQQARLVSSECNDECCCRPPNTSTSTSTTDSDTRLKCGRRDCHPNSMAAFIQFHPTFESPTLEHCPCRIPGKKDLVLILFHRSLTLTATCQGMMTISYDVGLSSPSPSPSEISLTLSFDDAQDHHLLLHREAVLSLFRSHLVNAQVGDNLSTRLALRYQDAAVFLGSTF